MELLMDKIMKEYARRRKEMGKEEAGFYRKL